MINRGFRKILWHTLWFFTTPHSSTGLCHAAIFLFHPHGRYAGCSDCGAEFADRDAAWKELTGVCGDMVDGISRKLKENGEWRMELLDASKKPVFRIRLVAETLD